VSPAEFERHVAYLAARYRVLPVPDIVAALRAGRTLPRHALAITFDDGYADNLEAARVLARYGLSATFYLTAGCLDDTGEPFWPAELRLLVARFPEGPLELQAGQAGSMVIEIGPPSERGQIVRRLSRLMKSSPLEARERLRATLRDLAGRPAYRSPMLSWTQVLEMQALGMTIGGHTLTHPNLPSIGRAAAEAEVRGCRQLLERVVGQPVTMFSYPNGGAERYYTPELQGLVRDAGFEAAATSTDGFVGAHSDLYALERVQAARTLAELAFALEIERVAFRPRRRAHEA
jgi:peptidoglycan/xylan/chitin deacetylase (PgdA/CDA1 family)